MFKRRKLIDENKLNWQDQFALGLLEFLEKDKGEVYWDILSSFTNITEIDYNALKERCSIYKEELIQVALHPSRIQKYLEQGIPFEELDNYI